MVIYEYEIDEVLNVYNLYVDIKRIWKMRLLLFLSCCKDVRDIWNVWNNDWFLKEYVVLRWCVEGNFEIG